MVLLLCTSSQEARNVHTKAGVNCTTDDKVMIWKQGTPTVTPYVAFSGDTKMICSVCL